MSSNSTQKELIQKIQVLKDQIYHHDYLYYVLDQPVISDYEYDQIFKQLIDLEDQHPELKTPDSPSQKIPGKALDKFQKSAHSIAMMSLQNSYSKGEIQTFYDRILKLVGANKIPCFIEPKLDGMAIELIYEKGILTKALTRGDGKVGEDITENIKTLKGFPLGLRAGDQEIPEVLEIRGEVVIFKKDFLKINTEQSEKGLSPFANPRNLVAGSLRQLDPKVPASRPLYCFIHSPGLMYQNTIQTQMKFIEYVNSLLLPSFRPCSSKTLKPPLELCRLAHSLEDILDYYDQMLSLRHKLPFEMDGIVIKVNDFEKQKELGAIARSPRWAMAGKFPPEEAVTQIKDIRLQVGRTGVVTPIAILEPLPLSGVMIRQASLHNFKDLGRKDVRIGDFALIRRAGDVIPEVIKPLPEKRNPELKVFSAPTHCPACQSELKQRGDYLMCQNAKCPDVRENKFIHFASKKAMNIEFLGEKSLKKFYQWGWLKSFSDIYSLKNKPLKDKEGFGEKSQDLLVESLEKSKKTTLPRVLFALGIPLVGEQTAEKISDKVYDIFEQTNKDKELDLKQALVLLRNMEQEELEGIPDIGPLAAQSFKGAFQDQALILDIQNLHKEGIFLKKKLKGGSLKGMKFVITGTLPVPRKEIQEKIIAQGGQLLSQISQSVDFLIEGVNPGSKREKAKELGIKILNWTEFLKIIN